MRVILFTGKGGVGKTTAAAGTAAAAARAGHRTLVLSTDAAHSLADAFDVPVGAEPTPVADRLFVQQVDAQQRFERSWADIQGYLLTVLDAAGVDPITAEELTVVPGRRGGARPPGAADAGPHRRLGRRRRRLRADRRDPAAAGAPGGPRVVHGPGLPGRTTHRQGAATGAGQGGRRPDAPRRRVRRRREAAPRPRGGARHPDRARRERAPGAHPRDGGRRRGATVADDAVAVRLPGRRRGGEPCLPLRRRRHVAADLGRGPVRRPRGGRAVVHRSADLALVVPGLRTGRRRRTGGVRRRGVRRRRPARTADVGEPDDRHANPLGRHAAASHYRSWRSPISTWPDMETSSW